jgi:hypothetical protein
LLEPPNDQKKSIKTSIKHRSDRSHTLNPSIGGSGLRVNAEVLGKIYDRKSNSRGTLHPEKESLIPRLGEPGFFLAWL